MKLKGGTEMHSDFMFLFHIAIFIIGKSELSLKVNEIMFLK